MKLTMSAAAIVVVVVVSFALSLAPSPASGTGLDYKDALEKSLLYFEAQRSGRLPHDQRVAWRRDSGLADGLQQGVDLVGGYYDAGDHVKFGLPMAFTITMLSWGVVEYSADIAAAGELRHALEAIKWGADYLVKSHTRPHELWAEVGDGDTDHYCWQRPEDMTTSRRAYKIDEKHPGSELAGETSAAMAAASIAFREANPHYSHLLLHHAQQLFEFADGWRGRYDGSVKAARGYYRSTSGYGDELLWAALWLHRATGQKRYLDYAVANGGGLGGTGWAVAEFSWDVKYAGVQILAAQALRGKQQEARGEEDHHLMQVLKQYKSKAEHYVCACLGLNGANGSNVERTPGGLLFVRRWNNMQYVSSAAFLVSVYSDLLAGAGNTLHCPGGEASRGNLLSLVRSQAEYILGRNPAGLSYLVGFGPRYPTRVHHRGASIDSVKEAPGFIGCTQGYDHWYGRAEANPNVLVGALVGGPGRDDLFGDVRGNFRQTEACTYNTAPLVGVLARMHGLEVAAAGERLILQPTTTTTTTTTTNAVATA